MLERQLVMKDSTENSWCDEVKMILEIYDLPSAYEVVRFHSFLDGGFTNSAYELFVNPPSKNEWKAILN